MSFSGAAFGPVGNACSQNGSLLRFTQTEESHVGIVRPPPLLSPSQSRPRGHTSNRTSRLAKQPAIGNDSPWSLPPDMSFFFFLAAVTLHSLQHYICLLCHTSWHFQAGTGVSHNWASTVKLCSHGTARKHKERFNYSVTFMQALHGCS